MNRPAPTGAAPAGLLQPLAIGALCLQKRLFMAPMAGISSVAFRRSVRRWGAGMVFTEMISSAGILYNNQRTLEYLARDADEYPIGFQLFGTKPTEMARAAEVCVAAGADLIDINMACPVRKVVKTGAGAALLAEPQAAGPAQARATRSTRATGSAWPWRLAWSKPARRPSACTRGMRPSCTGAPQTTSSPSDSAGACRFR